jgi:hypothetical protein
MSTHVNGHTFMSVSQENTAEPASWPSDERNTQLNKGKGKEPTENQEFSILRTSSDTLDAISSYPPINNDAEETRRVEEASLASAQLAAL